MFKKGEYIVLLAGCDGENTWPDQMPINYCYQLYKDSCDSDNGKIGFGVCISLSGGRNGWSCQNYNSSKYGLKMRYATPQEIEEYDRLGKPYDVTTLPKEPNYEIY